MLREEVLMTAPEASVGFVFRTHGKGETVRKLEYFFMAWLFQNPKKDNEIT